MPLLSNTAILINASVSSSFLIRYNRELERLTVKLPLAWTDADLKLQFSIDDGSNWEDVRDDAGDLYKITGLATSGGGAYSPPLDAERQDTWARVMNNLAPAIFRLVSIDTSDETAEVQLAARSVLIYGNYAK